MKLKDILMHFSYAFLCIQIIVRESTFFSPKFPETFFIIMLYFKVYHRGGTFSHSFHVHFFLLYDDTF